MLIAPVFFLCQVYTGRWQTRFVLSFFRQMCITYLGLHFINSKIHIFFSQFNVSEIEMHLKIRLLVFFF